MNATLETHRSAMEMLDLALDARRNGDTLLSQQMFRKAFESERLAAELALEGAAPEPTLSVLLRSAATLAVDCGELREAERLIAKALSGEPPAAIASELRELLSHVYEEWGLGRQAVAS